MNSPRPLVLAAVLALTLPLGACQREAGNNGAAAGEVLPGSASDAMLPVDRVTSQPPLDPRVGRGTGGEEAGAAATEAAGDAEAGKPEPVAEATGAAD